MSRVFSRRLTLTVPERVSDRAGGVIKAWAARGTLWAEVRMRSGGMRSTEFGEVPRLGLRITTHYLPQDHQMRPSPGDRLLDGGRTYAVEAVHDTIGRRPELSILASEVVGAESRS